ncbi:MAG: hypothetical protein R2706_00655 [Acidimicrobiales bacterium]
MGRPGRHVVERVVQGSPLLDLQVTEVQLLADLAAGFDVLIMGADKWHQICEPHWYGEASPSAARCSHDCLRLPSPGGNRC